MVIVGVIIGFFRWEKIVLDIVVTDLGGKIKDFT